MFTALKTARDRMEGQTQLKAEVDALRIMCLEGGAHLAAKAADAYGASPATLAVLTKAAAPAANTQTSPEITGPSKTPGFEMSMRSASVFDAIAAEALAGPFIREWQCLPGR